MPVKDGLDLLLDLFIAFLAGEFESGTSVLNRAGVSVGEGVHACVPSLFLAAWSYNTGMSNPKPQTLGSTPFRV